MNKDVHGLEDKSIGRRWSVYRLLAVGFWFLKPIAENHKLQGGEEMKRLGYLVLVAAFSFVCLLGHAQMKSNLVGLYLFDEEGDEVTDYSGMGNHGELQGGAERAAGVFGQAMEFNGADAFIEIPDSESLDLTTGLTIAMWININSYSSAGGVGVTKESAYKAGMRDHMKMMIRFSTPGHDWNNVVDGNTVIPTGEWHHVAATYDSATGECFIYYDGIEDGNGTFDGEIITNDDSVWIGRGQNPYFDGLYDEVAIWNVALPADQINKAMEMLSAIDLGDKLTANWGSIKETL
jgi:hypothetical protein